MKTIIFLLFLVLNVVLYANSGKPSLLHYEGNFYDGLVGELDDYIAYKFKPYGCISVENFTYNDYRIPEPRDPFNEYINIGINKASKNLNKFYNKKNNLIKLVSYDTEIYKFNESESTSLTFPIYMTTYDNYKRDGTSYRGVFYFGDGENANFKTDGDSIYLMGIERPSDTFTTSDTITGGRMKYGTYKYLLTYEIQSDNFDDIESSALDTPVTVIINLYLEDTSIVSDTEVNISDELFVDTGHPFADGEAVKLSVTGASRVPSPLIADTIYYIDYVDANRYQFSTTKANAYGNVNITLTDSGSGHFTVTQYEVEGYSVNITGLPVSTNSLVTHKNLYRTYNNGDVLEVYYKLIQLKNSETTFIDIYNDTELESTILERYGREVMPPCNKFIFYKGHLFATGNRNNPDRLYFSEFKQPEYNDVDYDYIDEINGLEITDLKVINKNLLVMTKTRTWIIYIPDEYVYNENSLFWRIYQYADNIGSLNIKASVNIGEEGIIFVSNKGIYSAGISFVGNMMVQGKFDYIGEEIKDIFYESISLYPDMLAACYANNKYYLSYSDNGLYPNKIYVYNIRSQRGSIYSGMYVNDFLYTSETNELLFASALKEGKIWQYNKKEKQYDGVEYIEATITTVSETYSSIYGESLALYTMSSRIDDTSSYSDTEIIDLLEGQTLYIYNSDSTYIGMTPIIWNDSYNIAVRTLIDGVDSGYTVKSGCRRHYLETIYTPLTEVPYEKTPQYLQIDMKGGTVTVYVAVTLTEPADTTINQTISSVGEGFFLNNNQYINDFTYINDDGFTVDYKRLSLPRTEKFQRIKFSFSYIDYKKAYIEQFFFFFEDTKQIKWR